MTGKHPRATGFGRTTTEKRFIAAFGGVVVVVGVAAYMTLAGLGELHKIMHDSVGMSQELILAHRLESGIHQTYAHQAHTVIMGDTSHLDRYEQANRALQDSIISARKAEAVSDSLLSAVAEAQKRSESVFRERLLPAVLSGDVLQVEAAHNDLLLNIATVEKVLEMETQRVVARLSGFDEHGSAIAHSGFRNALLILIGVALFTAVVGVALGRSVARPIAHLHLGARRIADGDQTARLPVTGPPEFQALAVQFNEMLVATREHQTLFLENEKLAEIGRLAAGVAHEINNPLGVIRGYARLVRKRSSDSQIHADVQVIEDECLRCHAIVRGLLDLARPSAEDAVKTPVRELVQEVVERMAQGPDSEHPQVSINGDASALANPRTLRQVLVNLLDNAVQADPGGNITVTLIDRGRFVDVIVADRGAGLPSEHRHRLFEPFFTTKDGGTGLGLAVSRAIARAHGGELVALNRDGGGAEFKLTLPSGNGGQET